MGAGRGWVESQRLDILRRFEAARVDADLTLADSAERAGTDRSPSECAALRRLKQSLRTEAGRFAAEEIALALNISVTRASHQLTLARDLHTVHPDLAEALRLGQVSGFVAAMVAQATRKLPDEARRVIDEAVTCDAVEQPAGRAITAAKARVSSADAYAEAAAERAVVARAARRTGSDDTLGSLRCDAFTDAMLGFTAPGPGDRHHFPEATLPARPVTVSVVISLTSLLGLDSTPGWLDGYGTITAGTAQRIIAGGDPTLTRLLCDPVTESTVVADPRRYTPGPALAHTVTCRDRHCRLPVCDARIRHLDHLRARVDAGLTTPDNLQGLCIRSHLAKHHPGWHVTGNTDTVVTWQTPTGHRYTSLPPPPTGPGTGPPEELDGPLDLPSWLSAAQRLRHAVTGRGHAA